MPVKNNDYDIPAIRIIVGLGISCPPPLDVKKQIYYLRPFLHFFSEHPNPDTLAFNRDEQTTRERSSPVTVDSARYFSNSTASSQRS